MKFIGLIVAILIFTAVIFLATKVWQPIDRKIPPIHNARYRVFVHQLYGHPGYYADRYVAQKDSMIIYEYYELHQTWQYREGSKVVPAYKVIDRISENIVWEKK